MRPYVGDLHNHCDLSYGHGRFADALARAALQLDFVSITGHAYWPDMPVDDPTVAHIVDFHVKGFARLRAGWGTAPRGHARLTARHALDVVVGMHALHYALAGNLDFSNFVRQVHGDAIMVGTHELASAWLASSDTTQVSNSAPREACVSTLAALRMPSSQDMSPTSRK